MMNEMLVKPSIDRRTRVQNYKVAVSTHVLWLRDFLAIFQEKTIRLWPKSFTSVMSKMQKENLLTLKLKVLHVFSIKSKV